MQSETLSVLHQTEASAHDPEIKCVIVAFEPSELRNTLFFFKSIISNPPNLNTQLSPGCSVNQRRADYSLNYSEC